MKGLIQKIGFLFLIASCTAEDQNSRTDVGQGQPYFLENSYLKVQISQEGAELQSLFHKKSASEILWIGDSTYWKGQSPVMFPVNVRFKDEKYTYQGKEYEMPRMGLAVLNTFMIKPESNSQKVVLSFTHTEDTKQQYPFDFNFEVAYQLIDSQLINRFSLSNLGKDTMYFALGGHPGFNCPFDNGLTRADYQYVFPKKMTIDRTAVINSLVQNEKISYLNDENRLSLNDARVPNGGMFLKELSIGEIGIARKGESPFVKVNLEDFPNVNLWSPPGVPFACIEPMISHHDTENSPVAIEDKSHLVQLNPGEIRHYQYRIIVPEKG